mmetsp:Transcript_180302/g.438773  ORF Transcript_180302/g.438773 Transcript_180302/m.438773 type:complete len:273 (+) Transcript_180302:199-1017(+)
MLIPWRKYTRGATVFSASGSYAPSPVMAATMRDRYSSSTCFGARCVVLAARPRPSPPAPAAPAEASTPGVLPPMLDAAVDAVADDGTLGSPRRMRSTCTMKPRSTLTLNRTCGAEGCTISTRLSARPARGSQHSHGAPESRKQTRTTTPSGPPGTTLRSSYFEPSCTNTSWASARAASWAMARPSSRVRGSACGSRNVDMSFLASSSFASAMNFASEAENSASPASWSRTTAGASRRSASHTSVSSCRGPGRPPWFSTRRHSCARLSAKVTA